MQNKKLMLISFFLFCFGLIGLQAQKAIVISGGNASGSGGTSSYTVGQVFYHTLAGTNGSVSQGVQQPFEISVVTGIEEAMAIQLMISAYPNPTVDFLILKVENYDREKFLYQLYEKGPICPKKSECIYYNCRDQTEMNLYEIPYRQITQSLAIQQGQHLFLH